MVTSFLGHLVSRRMEQFVCLYFTCILYINCSLVYSSTLSFPQFFAITKLNRTNYKQWVKSLMLNLMIMILNLALKVEAPPKPTVESSTKEKKSYED